MCTRISKQSHSPYCRSLQYLLASLLVCHSRFFRCTDCRDNDLCISYILYSFCVEFMIPSETFLSNPELINYIYYVSINDWSCTIRRTIVTKIMEKYSHKDSLQGVRLDGQTTMPSIPSANAFGITFELVSWMLRIIAEARVLYSWFSTGKIFPATFTDSSKNFECPKLTTFL